jgi:hypothetical protein
MREPTLEIDERVTEPDHLVGFTPPNRPLSLMAQIKPHIMDRR